MKIYEYDLKEILPRVQGPLREILDAELFAGNSMVEISSSWPQKNANVWLSRPFQKDYQQQHPSLTYGRPNDPHYWLDEYVDVERGLMVATKWCAGV